MLSFRLDRDSGLPAYLQIANQVREAIRFGWLSPGDQLPTVKDVATSSGLNPNTVLRAYRDLAADGVVDSRQGSGTFVTSGPVGTDPALLQRFRVRLDRWTRSALAAGLTVDDVDALLRTADVATLAASA